MKTTNNIIEAKKFSTTNIQLLKELLENEGNVLSNQFEEWWDIFEIQSYARKLNLSELQTWSILSNRFELKRK